MDTNRAGIDLILRSEGKKTLLSDGRYKSYLDTLPTNPVWTIWAGLTKGVGANTCWTEEECLEQFRKELNVYEDAIERMVTVPLNINQFSALTSLVYNIGHGNPAEKRKEHQKGFYWSTLRKLLNQGKYEQAAAQFKRYNKSGGVVYNGLITRRAAEAALFMTPVVALPEVKPVVASPDITVPIDIETAIPQSVDTPSVPFTEGAAKSPSVWSAISGLVSSIYLGWNWLFSVASETTAQAAQAKQSMSGLEVLFQHIGVPLVGLALAVTAGSLLVVLVRHLQRYSEGRG